MTRAAEDRVAFMATFESLAAKATELETRANDLRQELADLDQRMTAIANALHGATRSAGLPGEPIGEGD
ncbi:Prefoldin subunit alpha [Streptomyces sp. MBT84]|uniref:hypothetical protein n=1 Tax=unclassified Streptomyces TaxID=2593676 RepID=UPI001C6F5544|nr:MULTISPECIES: hypothetical protein [unclassified Streptomyces]MBW8698562.1 Prefoldin subunit alpha [Streptomyces sp. MBT84]MDX3263299.1 hypothetical protein [Streptomyces sp. MI02-2A]